MRNLIPKKETYPHSTNTHCRAIVYSYFVLVFLSLVIWRIKKFTWLPKYVTGRYIMLEVNLTHRWKYVLLSVTIMKWVSKWTQDLAGFHLSFWVHKPLICDIYFWREFLLYLLIFCQAHKDKKLSVCLSLNRRKQVREQNRKYLPSQKEMIRSHGRKRMDSKSN